MKKLLLGLTLLTINLSANTKPLHVELDIYANQSFLNKSFTLQNSGEITTQVPAYSTLENIKYKIASSCAIQKHNLSNTIKNPNENIEKLNEKKRQITHEIEALVAKESLLKSLSLQKIDKVSKIDSITLYLTKNLVANATQIDTLKKELTQIEKELKETQALDKEYKELKITYTCDRENKKLQIIYPQNSIKYTPFYNISANINNKSISIEKKATLLFQGTENFKNIDLNIYSYRYNQNVAPQPFYPTYLGEERPKVYKKALMAMNDSVKESSINTRNIQHTDLATKSVYKISNVSLFSGEKNLLHVDNQLINATFRSVIDAYGTNKAYLEAIIKTKKDYSSAYAQYFLDSNPVAKRYMEKIYKDKETKIYFGENEHIQVKKELIKTLDEKTFFGDKKVSTQNWKFTIINKNPYSENINFITKVPVSKDANIKVKTLVEPAFDTQNAKGKTQWNFTLKANQDKTIFFGYEISNSK
ncbi:DUF4139 domain-containing protein [Sulfurospirillum arcachonense]|uniref:DUF4139 domain-containing protein n=1 Tax=Sulfurospirillum arcachonense TaxID=57666 RepID=UPI0004681531|nr:DUF4139 domain-containing protein [Sulfurospirillum arcachonense]